MILREQVDIQRLDEELRSAKASRVERHEVVIRTLQDLARRSQYELLAELASDQADGRIQNFTPHWLVNAVLVEASASKMRALALREDVERLESNLVTSSTAVSEKSGNLVPASPITGVTDGLPALTATRAGAACAVPSMLASPMTTNA